MARRFAAAKLWTLAPSPNGKSITTYFEPTDFFFDITDAKTCPSGSNDNGYSARISLSSAGAKSRAPPQTRQPFVFSTIFFISSIEKETLQNTSIVSAVPAGLVIARDDVFGIVSPAAATIATTIGVTLFPGTPPILCLSTTYFRFHSKLSPSFTIARVTANTSLSLNPLVYTPETKAPSSISVSLFVATSWIISFISDGLSSSPSSFFFINSIDFGFKTGLTKSVVPFKIPYFSFDSFRIPI